jgi:DNA-binding FadR family transcriptional regulator
MEITRLNDGSKGFEKVFAFLRDRLLAGSLRPGDRLIPERELATQLGVSRPIVREALRALTVLGVVEIRDRVGTIVRRPDISRSRPISSTTSWKRGSRSNVRRSVWRPGGRPFWTSRS